MRFCLFMLLFAASSFGATYYVATGGSDSNGGSNPTTDAWLTVQHALDTAAASSVICVSPGTYEERPQTKAASVSLYGTNAILRGFDFKHTNCVLQGFIFTNIIQASDLNYAITIATGASGSQIVSNQFLNLFTNSFTSGRYMCVYWNGNGGFNWATNCASNCLIQGNLFSNTSYQVLWVRGQSNLVSQNIFRVSNGYDYIRLFGGYNTIRSNDFREMWEMAGNSEHCDVVQTHWITTEESHHQVFEQNTVVGSTNGQADLFYITCDITNGGQWGPMTFQNNLVLDVYSPSGTSMDQTRFFNNTFVHCAWGTNNSPQVFNINHRTNDWQYGHADNCEVLNNLFIGCGVTPTNVADGWYFVDYSEGYPSGTVTNYNMVAGPAPSYGSKQTSGNQFNCVWLEPNGINGGDPKFVNTTLSDYRLQSSSPAVGAGTNLSAYFTTDITGATRTRWSMGAYDLPVGLQTLNVSGSATIGTLRSAQ